jgi:hypothetical protein
MCYELGLDDEQLSAFLKELGECDKLVNEY